MVRSSDGAWSGETNSRQRETGEHRAFLCSLLLVRRKAVCASLTGTDASPARSQIHPSPREERAPCVTPGPDSKTGPSTALPPSKKPLVRTSRMDRRLSGKRGLPAKVPRGMAADGG